MDWITLYGVVAVTFMMTMYTLERRGSVFVLAFALGCALSSSYGFLSGAWPFGVVEGVWAFIALRRYADARRDERFYREQRGQGAAEGLPRAGRLDEETGTR